MPQTDIQIYLKFSNTEKYSHNLTQENLRQWDNVLPQHEFTYNNMLNQSTDKFSFEIVGMRMLLHS